MIDLGSQKSLNQLYAAMKTSWSSLRPWRENRQQVIKNYVGSEWGAGPEGSKRVLVNLLYLTAQTYMVALASNRPRILITAEDLQLQPFSKRFQIAMNNLIKEIHLDKTLQDIVLDAFFSIGIAKVYRASGNPMEIPNPAMPEEPGFNAGPDQWEQYRQIQQLIPGTVQVDPGRPMVERISLDDFGFDTQAERMHRARFQWHEYRVPKSVVEQDQRLDRKRVKEIGVSSKWSRHTFDHFHESRTEDLTSQHVGHDMDDAEPMVKLMDLYLPFEKKWAIMSADNGKLVPLFVTDWDGHENGPFSILGFDWTPDNPMPIGPAANLRQLHLLANALFRKHARQAERQKDVTAYMGDESDARQVKNAQDGGMVRMKNPDLIQQLKYGGVDQITLAFSQIVDGVFSRMAGNLDAKAGLGPQSGTARQDELIHGSVSRSEAKMQQGTLEFVTDISERLGHMLWGDRALSLQGSIQEPGMLYPVDASWTPLDREGDLIQYGLTIEPYSMSFRSPQERLAGIFGSLNAMAPYLQMSGATVDAQALAGIVQELTNEPRLGQLIQFGDPLMMQQMAMQGGGPEADSGPNETIRKNVSTQGSPDSQRTINVQSLTGNGAGPAAGNS